ncbi:MAG: ComC/BlpC family leader-containing pheromone/bacteriocin [Bacteroidales bacterium]|nr:ComC/BlpC family leader-containing pheromone/bacteriocin [Bacteroidales bacterium]NOU18473.1 ComC/BlpC family leader-containing pheromone/bacteriocin [Bacteroidales bacterium]
MKTIKKRNEKKMVKEFKTLKVKELSAIKGGEGAPIQKDGEIH